MLTLTISPPDMWDETKEEFVYIKPQVLTLEHSLVSISKWEQKWQVPFLGKKDLSAEETRDYVRCMTLTQNVNPAIYDYISPQNIKEIDEYMNQSMTATTFRNSGNTGRSARRSRAITSELIYYWMTVLNIPMECQKWHLNRLLTLIRICNEESQPSKKMSKAETAKMYAELNARRRKRLGTKG